VNSPYDDDEPAFSPDGERLAFSTWRNGHAEVMVANLKTGWLDRLPLANSDADDVTPYFLNGNGERLFFVSARSALPPALAGLPTAFLPGAGDRRLFIYTFATRKLDSLPIAHEVGSDDTLGAFLAP